MTIDAMGCQTKIAERIIAQGGDDLLALKGNQGTLAAEVEAAFIDADARDYKGVATEVVETVDRGHGCSETRRYRILGDLSGVARSVLWKGLNMLGMVESQRQSDGKVSTEYRCYIDSIGTDAACFAGAVRGHWGIGNDLHWSLDAAFGQDPSRIRDPQARENFAVLSHIALTRLKNDSTKPGIENKRLKSGWDRCYLAALPFQSAGAHPHGVSVGD